MITRYLFNLLLALDQLANSLLGGDPQETISSRADKAMRAGKHWGCVLCKLLSWIQKDHCQKAVEPDVGKKAVLPDDQ